MEQMPDLSPLGRRRWLRDSGDTDGQMKLEDYLLKADPYRSASCSIPPWPLFTTPAEVKSAVLPLYPEIDAILATHGFPDVCKICRVVEAHKPGYTGWRKLLLQIHYFNTDLPCQLGPAKDRIRELLVEQGLDLVFQPSLFPIHPEDPDVLVFETSRDKIISLLDSRLPTSWRLLGLYQLGPNEAKVLPTIVVIVDPNTACDWSMLDIDIRRLLSKPIVVEFLPGLLRTCASPASERPFPNQDGISFRPQMMKRGTELQMGWSVAVNGEQGGGTMGCFINLVKNGITRQGFLTSYHVVRPYNTATEEICVQLDRHGLSSHQSDLNIEVSFLTEKDVHATRQDIELDIQNADEVLREMQHKKSLRKMVGASVASRPQTLIDFYTKQRTRLRDIQNKIKPMPITVGRVTLASGKATKGSKILDWAFVELSEKSTQFSASNIMPDISDKEAPRHYGLATRFTSAAGVPLDDEFGRLEKGAYYLKTGRSSGTTGGVSNGTLTTCNWPSEDRCPDDSQGDEIIMTAKRTEEHAIFRKRPHQASCIQESFSVPGDSGSVVINSEGQICGLLYGAITGLAGVSSTESMYAEVGLAMDIRDVVQSMLEKCPDSKVMLPN